MFGDVVGKGWLGELEGLDDVEFYDFVDFEIDVVDVGVSDCFEVCYELDV